MLNLIYKIYIFYLKDLYNYYIFILLNDYNNIYK